VSIDRQYVCDLHKDCPEGEDEEQDCGECDKNCFKLSLSTLRAQKVKMFTLEQAMRGYAVVQLVEALRYKPEGRGFDFRLEFLIDIILPAALRPSGQLSF
jgi:hypothetical protein